MAVYLNLEGGTNYGNLNGGNHRMPQFTDVYPNKDAFLTQYKSIGIPVTITDESVTTLYFLLYSRYGNEYISASDRNRFEYNLFSIIWQYGPTWEKRVEIQKKFREMSEEELLKGSTQIYNTADNPGTAPTTSTLEELQYINHQNTTKAIRSKLDAYGMLESMLEKDVTGEFLNKFKKLFNPFAGPECNTLFITGDEDGY